MDKQHQPSSAIQMMRLGTIDFPNSLSNKRNAIASILEKPTDKRSEEEVEHLVSLIKNLNFFKERDIKEKYYPEIVACLKLQKVRSGSTVFEKGSIGETFYIIIKGTTSVIGPNKSKIEKIKKIKDEIEQK